jgi:AmiR/NasT family two-component response regulator
MQSNVYYHSPETGEYLCQVVMAAASIGQAGDFREISALGEENEADVVMVEYQNNNPDLDNWIVQTSGTPQSPEIFLFVDEESPLVLQKAIKLGAMEICCGTIPPEDFQEALARAELLRPGSGGEI